MFHILPNLRTTASLSSRRRLLSHLQKMSTYKPGDHSIAYITMPDEQTAKKMAHGLIEQKLAVCVNIIPQIISIYQWEGKVNEDTELLLMVKTTTSVVDELAKYVRDNHPYSVAEVISVKIENGNPPYLDWITQNVGNKIGQQ